MEKKNICLRRRKKTKKEKEENFRRRKVFLRRSRKRRKIVGEGKYFFGEEKQRMKRRKVIGEGKIGAGLWTEGSISTKSDVTGAPKCYDNKNGHCTAHRAVVRSVSSY